MIRRLGHQSREIAPERRPSRPDRQGRARRDLRRQRERRVIERPRRGELVGQPGKVTEDLLFRLLRALRVVDVYKTLLE